MTTRPWVSEIIANKQTHKAQYITRTFEVTTLWRYTNMSIMILLLSGTGTESGRCNQADISVFPESEYTHTAADLANLIATGHQCNERSEINTDTYSSSNRSIDRWSNVWSLVIRQRHRPNAPFIHDNSIDHF